MTSVVGIYNQALSHLGTRQTVQAVDEDSTEAKTCTIHYATTRDTLLRAHDWNFARGFETLAERAEDPPAGWGYLYSWPNLCLRFRSIWLGRPIIPPAKFAVVTVLDSGGNVVRAIATDEAEATGCFTRAIVDPLLFDPLFVRALSWQLACEIAMPLTSKREIWEGCERKAAATLLEAMAADASEGVPGVEAYEPESLSVRG